MIQWVHEQPSPDGGGYVCQPVLPLYQCTRTRKNEGPRNTRRGFVIVNRRLG